MYSEHEFAIVKHLPADSTGRRLFRCARPGCQLQVRSSRNKVRGVRCVGRGGWGDQVATMIEHTLHAMGLSKPRACRCQKRKHWLNRIGWSIGGTVKSAIRNP